jgi:hypothetical protein
MQAQVGIRMSLCVGGDFGEPGARHHDAGGSYGILVKRVEAGSVHGMGDGEIVSMDDKKFRVGRIAQALGNGFILGARASCCEKNEEANGGVLWNAHRQLQRAGLAVKGNTTAEASKLQFRLKPTVEFSQEYLLK